MSYLLTIRVKYEAFDYMAARMKAKELLKEMKVPEESAVKLQEVTENKPPKGIEI